MLKFMLDTNICIFTIKNRPQSVREVFKRHHGQMCISAVTLMEMIYGAEKSPNPEHNLADIEGFAARLEVLKYDQAAAAHTGQLRDNWPGRGHLSAPMTK
jgi:tRNA(fMet)-specific endonuclease VapC